MGLNVIHISKRGPCPKSYRGVAAQTYVELNVCAWLYTYTINWTIRIGSSHKSIDISDYIIAHSFAIELRPTTDILFDGGMRACTYLLPNTDAFRQIPNISSNLVGNKLADHSDVVGASPVGAAPTTSSTST